MGRRVSMAAKFGFSASAGLPAITKSSKLQTLLMLLSVNISLSSTTSGFIFHSAQHEQCNGHMTNVTTSLNVLIIDDRNYLETSKKDKHPAAATCCLSSRSPAQWSSSLGRDTMAMVIWSKAMLSEWKFENIATPLHVIKSILTWALIFLDSNCYRSCIIIK